MRRPQRKKLASFDQGILVKKGCSSKGFMPNSSKQPPYSATLLLQQSQPISIFSLTKALSTLTTKVVSSIQAQVLCVCDNPVEDKLLSCTSCKHSVPHGGVNAQGQAVAPGQYAHVLIYWRYINGRCWPGVIASHVRVDKGESTCRQKPMELGGTLSLLNMTNTHER